uniref:DUF547 domain-containing protein n=1 Tax=Toxocara canis TaxID=6265 RepID=A0A183U2I9_TOXCA
LLRLFQLALNVPIPLVHFAVNYGTKSGPPIRLYSIEKVIEEMQTAARDFLSCDDNLRIDVKKSIIFLPSIFKWYAEDFGGSKRKVHFYIDKLHSGRSNQADKHTYIYVPYVHKHVGLTVRLRDSQKQSKTRLCSFTTIVIRIKSVITKPAVLFFEASDFYQNITFLHDSFNLRTTS